MKERPFIFAAAVALMLFIQCREAAGARQLVAMFPLQNLSDNAISADVENLGKAIAEKLKDRFDVRTLAAEADLDTTQKRKKVHGVGATYILGGAVSRIGSTVTLDLTLSATEDPSNSRTVVVNGIDDRKTADPGGSPPVYARLATESAAKLKYLFFGDEVIGEGAARRKIMKPGGIVSRSRNIQGDVVSIARMDTDRDGKMEVVAAYEDRIAVYRVDGDDLVEKAVIADSLNGLVHLDAADINRNGIAEIIAVRYVAGKSVSDIWENDGRKYNKVAHDIPFFIRTIDMGEEGIVLVAQESDPVTIFKGPVFRISLTDGAVSTVKKPPLPLPDGTGIYSFTMLKKGKDVRYVMPGERERLILLDDKGKKLWEGIDGISGSETALEAAVPPAGRDPLSGANKIFLPNRLFAIDLDGDRIDEMIVLNNLVTAGGFFESIRVFSNSEALCFAQDGDSLRLAWRTAQTGASARDAVIDFSQTSRTMRIGIASKDKGKLLGRFGEWRMFWLK